jgi:hypothetical protein
MQARFVVWQAIAGPARLAEANRLLEHLVAHAPYDCHASMLANLRLNREIVAAAKAAGL